MKDHIKQRIEMAACEYIQLQDDESDDYHGCGLYLASFTDGKITGLLKVCDLDGDDAKDIAKQTYQWCDEQGGDIVVANGSCYQLCRPEPFDISNQSQREGFELAIQQFLFA